MIRKAGELTQSQITGLQGGKGVIGLEHMLELDKGEFSGKGRLYSILTVAPGDSIGYHVHKGEMECFYVLEGEADYNDNGTKETIKKGDTIITFDGNGHSVDNNSDAELKLIALILFT